MAIGDSKQCEFEILTTEQNGVMSPNFWGHGQITWLTWLNYNKKSQKYPPPLKKKKLDPIKWAYGKIFVTQVSFKLLTRFWCLNVREFHGFYAFYATLRPKYV